MGPELVQSTNEAIQKIKARMQAVQSRQKSYVYMRWKYLEFDVGDKVFLKVTAMNGILRFEKKENLSPHFVETFEILERIGPVAYRWALPPSLTVVHDMFYVLMLRKLTKSAYFIPRKSTYTANKWAQLYLIEIVRLHGVPVSIVSDRDARFTFKF
ncbi:pol protein [Cucumis melo var. makuwa]|uniref:Pol protein n=1 Tax=Cucumis melo var. makuwa TaxID=1194695 RepID=A0A5D3CBX9_CUCMM|nr:pol protein [Cucumis melo var. makuwa]TYK08840.1 pol protein [Cucumis melo var. makuwa]